MKRKYADRLHWQRVTQRQFDVRWVESPEFTGYVTRLFIERVRAPLVLDIGGREYTVADAGYTWLQHFPAGACHTVTTMFDAQGTVVESYIDIVAGTGVDERGIPWWDDLYLDIVAPAEGEPFLCDADELQEALDEGLVTTDEYHRAWDEARRLMTQIRDGEMIILSLVAGTPRDALAPSQPTGPDAFIE